MLPVTFGILDNSFGLHQIQRNRTTTNTHKESAHTWLAVANCCLFCPCTNPETCEHVVITLLLCNLIQIMGKVLVMSVTR